jgi:hypothetical protein
LAHSPEHGLAQIEAVAEHDRPGAGVDLSVELHERRAQRRRIAEIEQIETFVHEIHTGERRGVRPPIERAGGRPGIAAAGERPVEQGLGADRLAVDVIC